MKAEKGSAGQGEGLPPVWLWHLSPNGKDVSPTLVGETCLTGPSSPLSLVGI